MLTFVENLGWVVAMALGLAVAGGVVVRPFAPSLPFSPLLQPLAGLLMVVVGTLALYVVLQLPLGLAGSIAWATCCLATIAGLDRKRWRTWARADYCAFIGISVLTATLATLVTTATSIHHDEPGFVYLDGTDHLGYAHMADWLNGHLVSELPVLDSTKPYTSWPHFLVSYDPRFGSFTTLALVAQVLGRSGMFSYDLACALVLTITVLALAAVFAKDWVSLGMLVLGLLTCHWFDYNRTGFFAKAIAFPSIFFVAGLFIVVSTKRMTPFSITILMLLAAAAALMQSGVSEALFLTVLGGTYLLSWGAYSIAEYRTRRSPGPSQHQVLVVVRDGGIVLGLLASTAVIASGTLARPLRPGFPDWGYAWQVIFPRVADLEAQTLAVSVMSPRQLHLALFITVCLWGSAALLAIAYRDSVATSMIVGPAALLIGLRIADQRAMAFQMIGVFYPLALCGVASLAPAHCRPVGWIGSWRPKRPLALSMMGIALLLHCPRFINSVVRYGPDAPTERQFLQGEMQGLALAIGDEPVKVDVGFDLNLAIAVLVELGRQDIALQWTPDSWRAILGYRPTWPVPQYSGRAPLRLVKRYAPMPTAHRVVFLTQQFKLICPSLAPDDGIGALEAGRDGVLRLLDPKVSSVSESGAARPTKGTSRSLTVVRWTSRVCPSTPTHGPGAVASPVDRISPE